MKEELKILLDRVASTVTLSESETDAMMREAFALAETPQEKREAGAYLRQVISRRKRPDVDVKGILGEASEFLNLSYISKRYFNKDRTWLYQRLNKSIVNGKPAAFTETELRILSDSLNEISHIVQQTSSNLTHYY